MATQNQILQDYYSRIANSSDLESVFNDSLSLIRFTNIDLFNQLVSAPPYAKQAALTAFINSIRSGNIPDAEFNARKTLPSSSFPVLAEADRAGANSSDHSEPSPGLSSTGLMSTGLDLSNFGNTLSAVPGTLGLLGAGAQAAGAGLVGLAGQGMVGFADPAAGGFPSQAEANAIAAENAGIGNTDDGAIGSGGNGVDGNDGPNSGGGPDNGWAKGGKVTSGRLKGPNPKGPDDGYGALDHGEYVIKASVVKSIGEAKLRALNEGRADVVVRKK
jgi:hypothetical protein